MKLVKFKLEVNVSDQAQLTALNNLLSAMGGSVPQTEKSNLSIVPGEEDSPEDDQESEEQKAARVKREKAAERRRKTKEKKVAEAAAAEAAASDAGPEEEDPSEITTETLRQLVAAKIGANRDAVKDAIAEMGGKNVSTIPTDKYAEFIEILEALD